MNRSSAIAILILLVAAVLGPYRSPGGGSAAQPNLYPDAITSGAATQPTLSAATRPTTVPAFAAIRGQQGFWRLARTAEGVWWFVSPDGKREFLNAVTTVQPQQAARDKDGPEFVSSDFAADSSDPGRLDAWAQATLKRIRAAGFKSLGAWCNPAFHQLDVPITRDLNLTPWCGSGGLRFYSSDWPVVADRAVRTQVEPLRDNRNLVGYYLDNELDWGDAAIGPAVHFDHLDPADRNRREVIRVMLSLWPTIDAFNKDWKSAIGSWEDLDDWKTLPHEQREPYGRLFTAWLSHFAKDYFKLTAGLVRKYDPNHLILGVRFKSYAPPEVVRASRDHTDAQSINVYPGDARLDPETFGRMYELSGQPIIISEYSFHALDGRSGNRNTFGFSAQVLDQQARADAYRMMTTRAARVPYIVGADWFQWMDEPPSGRADGEDVNFGVVDIDDRPYEMLVESIRRTTPLLNGLHENSHRDEQKDVWRESYASKPVFNVPFLSRVPKLNGELSDWPAVARIKGIRHSQTIGLERSPLPLPNVFMGWTAEGLYVGLEVFDNDIQGAPPRGWWWTRDCVELYISTRPVASDQESYNEYCHQFFFVPMDVPLEDRFVGCVGQWHRPGDALKDHLIPHPEAREAVRILPGRYVVEMFLPAKALSGYDPKGQPAMAFNMHVRNFQHATEYFWSAPKEVMTQQRPSTWGTAYLASPEKTLVAEQAEAAAR